jgi:hypothetical protein
VVDATGLKAKFRALPDTIEEALKKQFEKEAEKLVKEMRLFLGASWPALEDDIEINWTWGDAPAGAVTVGSYGRKDTAALVVTIYARAVSGSGVSAAWFEFGTAERVQKKTGRRTGRITASPFFFPPYRANRQRIRNNLRGALRRAVRKLNA